MQEPCGKKLHRCIVQGVIEEEKAIVEIKCFPSLARNSQDIFFAAKERKKFPIWVDDTGN